MAVNIDEYDSQLQSVEQCLQNTKNEEERIALASLKTDLLELIELTKETHEKEALQNEDRCVLNEELEKFNSEIAQLSNDDTAGKITQDCSEDVKKFPELEFELENIIGQKCSAPHQHSWGATSYHNAIVCSIEVTAHTARLRILFTNPTHREMLPCLFFLEGECRFDDMHCHYSHGELVDVDQLGNYTEPDFTRLARNCVVLAKLPDRLWHRGRVLCANFIEKICRVRLDRKDENKRERDFSFEDLLPIFHDDDLSSGSSSGSDDEVINSEGSEYMKISKRTQLTEQSLFEFKTAEPLGEWEKHTRGIGSKIMAKMGYIHGKGLGSDGDGIIIPVTAKILPQGCSLDRCMELREAANGDKDFFSVEKKVRLQKKRQVNYNTKAYEREAQRKDVFTFINDKILRGGFDLKDTQKKTSLSSETTKSLNVASVRIADDIRRKEREITKLRQSMSRNTSSSDLHKRSKQQLKIKMQELTALRKEETNLSQEQASRKTKDKLCVF
ncbi:zinc finger CCCH-type with G patch domain-containing protein [Rhagoletis pomonella]|uniref:zinc finger CCCH-type with G patch domain-containing protein n=1 Tax=Rhagoletis pomonella TaxID=28610 RepID=UPI0017807FAE|nr:zinc finger CCCH-type with G patch domain-containing protein [Rhagoletis pomonella]